MRLIRTGEELSTAVIVPARFLTVLLGSFAAIAVLLTVTGLCGLLSSMVAKRQREIGVRIALGAAMTSAVAAFVPAARTASVDPMQAFRSE